MTPSIQGARYCVAFTDDYSGLCSLYFTRTKDAVPSALDEFLTTKAALYKTWEGPMTLQSDSEPVYMGAKCVLSV